MCKPQSLYSTSLPLQYLWPVGDLLVLSDCTVHVYFYTHYGPYSLYRVSMHVQYICTSTPLRPGQPLQNLVAIYILLQFWNVEMVHRLSASRVQLNVFFPMGRTACTELQRL